MNEHEHIHTTKFMKNSHHSCCVIVFEVWFEVLQFVLLVIHMIMCRWSTKREFRTSWIMFWRHMKQLAIAIHSSECRWSSFEIMQKSTGCFSDHNNTPEFLEVQQGWLSVGRLTLLILCILWFHIWYWNVCVSLTCMIFVMSSRWPL